MAVSGEYLGSTALDRYTRVHSTAPLPAEAGAHQESRGEVLDKVYMISTPTAITCDYESADGSSTTVEKINVPDDDDVWDGMAVVDDRDDIEGRKRPRK